MFAQCPACLTVFELDAAALAAAHGRVRCGDCDAVFDALRTLTDRLPEPIDDRLETLPLRFVPPEVSQSVWRVCAPADAADHAPAAASCAWPESLLIEPSDRAAEAAEDSRPATSGRAATGAADASTSTALAAADQPPDDATRDDATRDNATGDYGERDRAQASEPALAFAAAFAARADGTPWWVASPAPDDAQDDDGTSPRAQAEPEFLRTATAPRARNGRWLLLVTVLALVLFGEIAWAERTRWIDRASVRAWLDPLCSRIHCTLPLRHDVDRLQLVSRDVHAHPSVPGALIISATLRNDAAFAQAFPAVSITLSDLDETRIAMRRFQPQEYLRDADASARGIGAGATTTLAFEVADPGKRAIAFEFGFER